MCSVRPLCTVQVSVSSRVKAFDVGQNPTPHELLQLRTRAEKAERARADSERVLQELRGRLEASERGKAELKERLAKSKSELTQVTEEVFDAMQSRDTAVGAQHHAILNANERAERAEQQLAERDSGWAFERMRLESQLAARGQEAETLQQEIRTLQQRGNASAEDKARISLLEQASPGADVDGFSSSAPNLGAHVGYVTCRS